MTIIPVLLITDKMQLTMHYSNKSLWPVYITIGNLNQKTCWQQNLSTNLLLGFIFNIKSIDYDIWSACYYKAIEEMLKCKCLIYNKYEPCLTSLVALESLWYKGINMEYADGKIRQCYPVICRIMADYEEQVLITSVKSQQHCTICQVPPNRCKNLLKCYLFRTHKSIKKQIAAQ